MDEHPDHPMTLTVPRSWLDALATAAAIGADTDAALTTDPTLTTALELLHDLLGD